MIRPLLLACTVALAHASDRPLLVDLRFAVDDVLRAQLVSTAAGLHGAIMTVPALAPLAEDPAAALADVTAVRVAVVATGRETTLVDCTIDCGGSATRWWTALSAGHQPDADGMVAVDGVRVRRDGSTLRVLVGDGEPGPASTLAADRWLHVDVAAMVARSRNAELTRVIEAMALTAIDGASAGGTPYLLLPRAQLPLGVVDGAALRVLPADPLLVFAVAIDGQKAGDLAVMASDASGRYADTLRQRALETGGTLAVAVTSVAGPAGAPSLPALTVSAPSSAEFDELVSAALSSADPSFDAQAADTATQTVTMRSPLPVTAQVRRAHGRWLISSDAAVYARLLAGEAGGYDVQLPGACGALLREDMAALMRVAAVMTTRFATPEQQPSARSIAAVLTKRAEVMRPIDVAALTTPEGIRIDLGGEATTLVATASLATSLILPAIATTKTHVGNARTSNNLHQLMTGIIAWENDHDTVPPDLATVVRDLELPATLLTVRGATVPPPHIVYVRPAAEVDFEQVVLVENPACEGGAGAAVAYADGHVAVVQGAAAQRLWADANRLSTSLQARGEGVTARDWAAVSDGSTVPSDEAPRSDEGLDVAP